MAKPRILIVEDELIIATDLQCSLRDAGFDVLEPVRSGREAVERALEGDVDLVLMDISLSDLTDGLEAAKSIRGQSDVPIVFITGWSDSSIVSQAQKISPAGCLLKPVAPEDLLQVVTNAIERSRFKP
jgi:DNA-binding NarL/FixJ family response regulator